jgi:hypothetical protein
MGPADAVVAPRSDVQLVDPANALRSVLSLHDVLGGLRGTVRICDPYVDRRTIEHLDAIPRTNRIQLLTKNVTEPDSLRRVVSAAQRDRPLEVRLGTGEPIHDRYILDDEGMLLLGTSLNGFGKKQSFVVRIGADLRRITQPVFDAMWQRGVAL